MEITRKPYSDYFIKNVLVVSRSLILRTLSGLAFRNLPLYKNMFPFSTLPGIPFNTAKELSANRDKLEPTRPKTGIDRPNLRRGSSKFEGHNVPV
jgi:hypothetical protein